MMHDDELLDSVALLALGVLGEAEAREVRRAIDGDDRLREEYLALRASADLVGYAAESETVDEVQSARMKSRLRRAIGASAPPAQRQRRVVWPAWVAAAAGLVLALLTTLQNVGLRSDLQAARDDADSLRTRVATETKRANDRETQLADLLAPDAKRYAVSDGQVIQRGDRLYLALSALPKLPRGKVFQAWTLGTGEKAVAPSITFTAADNGSALIALPPQSKRLAAVAISVEPEGGSRAPTTKPLWVRPLS
jgi:anti-sigma-K factor RskA